MATKKASSRPGLRTAARILDAAERLFTVYGFEGTSTRAIADAAHANIGLLAYYFGSKEGLFDAALSRRIEQLMNEINHSINENLPPLPLLRNVLTQTASHMADPHAPILALAVRESLSPIPTPVTDRVALLLHPHRAAVLHIVESGLRERIFQNVDPAQFYRIAMGALAVNGAAPSLESPAHENTIETAVGLLISGIRAGTYEERTPEPQPANATNSALPADPADDDPFEIGVVD